MRLQKGPKRHTVTIFSDGERREEMLRWNKSKSLMPESAC